MTDILQIDGNRIDINRLPAGLQKKVRDYAVLDILKDQARDTLEAGQVDIDKCKIAWLKLKKSPRTREMYSRSLDIFLKFLERRGVIHPALVKAEDVDAYIVELKSIYKSSNTVRVRIAAASSFYKSLKRWGHIKQNPFIGCELPGREYKTAIKTDQARTVPVMTAEEYSAIMEHIKSESMIKGKRAFQKNRRAAARSLSPVIHFLGTYGLRVGAVPSITIRDKDFTYLTKGRRSGRQDLKPETSKILKKRPGSKPFKNKKIITIQKAFSRITDKLSKAGTIRYKYSCHSLRHFFAAKHYQEHRDVLALKNILGHASINITDIYLQNLGA